MGKRIPVEWQGVSILKGEGEYGCIVSGNVVAIGSDNTTLSSDLNAQIQALYNSLNSPGSYTGTFGQAIEAMKTLATELATKGTVDKNDPILTRFKSVCSAVNKGTQQWINEINEKVGANPTQETTALIAAIGSAKTKVLEMLDCGNANNSNAAPVVPKKGPFRDDRFLLADCNYANAQLGADELATQIDNNKAIFTPPPTNKLTCIVKLSELKTQLSTAINAFVCPDGGLVTLADADEINFYTYDKSWYPNGSILGIKKGNKNYIVRIFKSGSGQNFTGFVDYDSWKANGYPPNTSFHSTAPTLNQDSQVWAIEQSEDQQVRAIGIANYRALSYTQGVIEGDKNRLNYVLDQTGSSCNFINNAKDATPKDGYSSQAGLEDLKTKLNTYDGLGDVVFKVTDKAGKTSYVTKGKIYKPEDAFPKPTNATIFEITEDTDGKVEVGGTFKADPTCATCAEAAQTALTAALGNMKAKHGGKIDPKKNVIEGETILSGVGGGNGITYQNMSLGEALTALAKGYNSILDNAKVPEEMWKTGKVFPVRDYTGVLSGSADQVLEDGKDMASMVGIGLTIIANPKKAKDDLVAFTQNITWAKAGEMLKTVVKEGTNYNYLISSDAQELRYGVGRSAVTLVKVAAGVGLVAMLKSPDELAGMLAKVKRLLDILKTKLNDVSLEEVLETDLADDALYHALDADNDLVKSWEVLNDLPNVRKNINVLKQVKTLMSNPKAVTLFGDANQLKTSLNKLAKTFDASTWPNKLSFEEALSQLNKSVNNFQGVIGFDESLKKAITNSNVYVQDGLWFSLKDMDRLNASNIKGVDLSFEIDGLGNSLPCTSANGKCFDVELNPTITEPLRFIEYKSVQYFKDPITGKLRFNVGQLNTYLENVNKLSELNYVFNKAKIADPKKFMKTIFEENAAEIWVGGKKKGLFNGLELKNGTIVDDSDTFLSYLKEIDTSNELFDFVK